MSRLTNTLIQQRFFQSHPLYLIDIGASGGLDPRWQILGPGLTALGIDPDPHEVNRLTQQETRPHVQYLAAWAGSPAFAAKLPQERAAWRTASFTHYRRSAPEWAERILGHRYPVADRQHGGTPRETSVDELYQQVSWPYLDFLKIDTDGHDLEVLHGATETLKHTGMVHIEVQFLGQSHKLANNFANIDTFLRKSGFTLGDLEVYRYARAALPDTFTGPQPGPTRRGGVAWGEALYFRETPPLDDHRLTTLACMLELHGLHDYAVETVLLAKCIGSLSPTQAADLLAQGWWPQAPDRQTILDAFTRHPLDFTPSGPWGSPPTRLRDRLRAWLRNRK